MQPANRTDVNQLLGTDSRRLWRQPWLWVSVALLLAALGGTGWWWQQRAQRNDTPRYLTEPVVRGDLSIRVSANGTLQPTRTVNVGSELSGTVARVLADVNDRVKAGQVLAELDTAKLRDQIDRSRAAMASAQARVAQAAATAAEMRRKLERQRGIERLSEGMFPAQADLDAAQAAHDRAVADEAAANASVADARAAARVDATNLARASIRAPTDGVVLVRNVDPGNAVAASLQAVTLFSIAEDLTRMKLQINVDEADVGQVREGQRASFTVSAYPNRSWPATIRRVGYGSTTKDNVVTYLADLDVANDDLSLRPGMSAVAMIAASDRRGVLLVPNAALRFTPSSTAAPAATGSGSIVSRLVPRPPGAGQPRRAGTNAAAARQVWVLRDGVPVAVPVTPGLSDGRRAEVAGEGLREGDAVITDQGGARAMSDLQAATGQALIRLRGLTKVYGSGSTALTALAGIDLDIDAGEFVAIMGPSGSGKSTAMNLIGCLDTPTSGEYLFHGVHVERLSRDERARLRRRHLGFVFQGFNLLARTSAQENVELPLLYRGESAAARHAAAREALASVGLEGWGHHTPAELSGGQQQRVAIARAIVTRPTVLLADEPTGNLDTQRSREIMELLVALNRQRSITILMVTHEAEMAAFARRIVRFVDGRIASDTRSAALAA